MRLNYSAKGAFVCLALATAAIFGCQKTSVDEMGTAQALKGAGTTSSNCNLYNVTVAKTYNLSLNQTTFTWTVYNTAPGNGTNGTAQNLSHWDMSLCDRAAANLVSASMNGVPFTPTYAVDPAMGCVTTPVLKFNLGTVGSTSNTYSVTLAGTYSLGTGTGYFKAGTDCCTRSFPGISCEPEAAVCSYSQGYWFANAAHSWNGQTVTLGGYTYTQAEGQALWAAHPGGSAGSGLKVFYQASAILLSIPTADIPAEVAADVQIINLALTGLGKLTASNTPDVTADAVAAAGRISSFICLHHCGSIEVDPTACATF